MRAELETCPVFQKARKVSESFVREICNRVNVKDLPKGKRMQWVNRLTNELTHIMKSDRPVRKLHQAIEDVMRGVERDITRYLERVERMEQEMGKGM